MIQKKCPYCRGESFSSYNDPNWRCPYCGKIINLMKNSKEKPDIYPSNGDRKVVNFNEFRNNV